MKERSTIRVTLTLLEKIAPIVNVNTGSNALDIELLSKWMWSNKPDDPAHETSHKVEFCMLFECSHPQVHLIHSLHKVEHAIVG